ncbi:hypothetical protein QR680_011939 [Steinernema hermaphroditum]|uniref:C2H2-type domain-containing protein n=1 Tax=Steinernema hermaphroditum TaxID=289476 RepID=A0AA39I093_9BILA|nr:hypothetical protein QR680_011939 [Steinernema hermaphroditum]
MNIDGESQLIHTAEQFNAFSWVTCHLCSQKFLNKEDLREHVIIGHPQSSRPFSLPVSCDVCSATFSDNLRLFRHEENVHFGTMKNVMRIEYVCSLCSQKFIDLTSFEEHSVRERHTIWVTSQLSVSRIFYCRFCDKKLSSFTLLRNHQRIQHRVVPKEAENGKLLYDSKKANRCSRLDFYSARPRGRPPKVRVDEAHCSAWNYDEEEVAMIEDMESATDQINVTTVEDEVEGFGCPYCAYFGEDYDAVATHTAEHYQAILARQQPLEVVENPSEEDRASDAIELNSEVINFLEKDRSFLNPEIEEWIEE